MRISCDVKSDFYNSHIAKDVHYFVNGEFVPHCVEASEEDGWAIINVRTADDKPVFRRGKIERRTIHGRVELRPKHRLDERTQFAVEHLAQMVLDLRSGKVTLEQFDINTETIQANVMGDQWVQHEHTGRRAYTFCVVTT